MDVRERPPFPGQTPTTGAGYLGNQADYNIDRDAGSAEFGRWVLNSSNIAVALDSAYLLYEFAFTVLELQSVYTMIWEDNEPVAR